MAKRSRSQSVTAEVGTVIFNVGGQHFEVLRQTIEARPSTLLAVLIDDIGTDAARPVFVDANPERFAYILDWYRHGEIHLPDGFPMKAVINDARFFLLPDRLKINGSSHTLQRPSGDDLRHEAFATTIKDWPDFDQSITAIVAEVRGHLEAASERTSGHRNEDVKLVGKESVGTDLLVKKEFVLSSVANRRRKHHWQGNVDVCNKERLKFLVAELTKRGFECEVTGPKDAKGQAVVLSVGLRECGPGGTSGGPACFRLDGVGVADGRLQVCSQTRPEASSSE